MGAAKGEKCGLCGNPMNEGAVVCGFCGAERKLVDKGCLPIIGAFLLLASAMPASCIFLSGEGSEVWGVGGIVGLAIGLLLNLFGGTKKVVYQKR